MKLTHKEIENLNKEFAFYRVTLRKAIKLVKKRKFLRGLFYSPFKGFGKLKPEVQTEWIKLK